MLYYTQIYLLIGILSVALIHISDGKFKDTELDIFSNIDDHQVIHNVYVTNTTTYPTVSSPIGIDETEKSRRKLAASDTIPDLNYAIDPTLTIYHDPSDHYHAPTALGVYVQTVDPSAKIYYMIDSTWEGIVPSLTSSYATNAEPYIQIDNPFGSTRNRTLVMIAVAPLALTFVISKTYVLHFTVESSDRPDSFLFLVPGIESSGSFLRVGIEMKAAARAQVAGGQEFADFYTNLSIGTYATQIRRLHLPSIDPDLKSFEGGFAANCSFSTYDHYGFLVPHHDGSRFYGKVVRVNLLGMEDIAACQASWFAEEYDSVTKKVKRTGTATASEACVYIINLVSLHPDARGFRRGFVGYPYAYLSPGEFSVAVRLDLEKYGINTLRLIDLSTADQKYGGYSGGFADGTWACFNPFRSYTGPVGGIRSKNAADVNTLQVYYQSVLLCVNETGWNGVGDLASSIRAIDLSNVQPALRGFSEAIRVGRYAYFAPMMYTTHDYTSVLIRLYLGPVDIGVQYDKVFASDSTIKLRDIVDLLDLSQANPNLKGFSGLFSAGKYLYVVPYRNFHTPSIGQRGHGYVARINMNTFALDDVTYMDLPTTTRTQIPSFADTDLVGFSGGVASGKYAILFPFFNGIFSGKVARFKLLDDTLDTNLQELDLQTDRYYPQTYKAFRGGFTSLWQGAVTAGE